MTIYIKGCIIPNECKPAYAFWNMDATCPNDVKEALNASKADEPILVMIDSPGGNIHAASTIYTMLQDVNAQAHITGLAASAASMIAMACRDIFMSDTALFMIHNVSAVAAGDVHTMQSAADMLAAANKSVANAYMQRTGKSLEELQALMDKETWMDVEEAVALGFVDGRIVGDGEEVALDGQENSGGTDKNDNAPTTIVEDRKEKREAVCLQPAAALGYMLPDAVVKKTLADMRACQMKLNALKTKEVSFHD